MKIIILITLFVPVSIFLQSQKGQAVLPASKNKFIIIAHRGNHVKVPENTVESVREAIRAGADYAEIDLRTTRDGYLVLSHDATVDRMTNGKGPVKNWLFADLIKLRVTSPNPADSSVYHIPAFREILDLCKGRINIYLDFKDADVQKTYRQLKAAGMDKQVVVYLNDEGQYTSWVNTAPAIPLMSSIPDTVKTAEQLRDFLKKVPLKVADNIIDPALVIAARKNGLSVWLDVEDAHENPAIWQEAMRNEIQGLQTDHPDELIRYLKENNLRNGTNR